MENISYVDHKADNTIKYRGQCHGHSRRIRNFLIFALNISYPRWSFSIRHRSRPHGCCRKILYFKKCSGFNRVKNMSTYSDHDAEALATIAVGCMDDWMPMGIADVATDKSLRGRYKESWEEYLCRYTLPEGSKSSDKALSLDSNRRSLWAPRLTPRIHEPLASVLSMWGNIKPREARWRRWIWIFWLGHRSYKRFKTLVSPTNPSSGQDVRCISR